MQDRVSGALFTGLAWSFSTQISIPAVVIRGRAPPPPAMAAASSTPVVVRSAAPAHWEGAQPSAPTPAVSRVLGRWRGARPPRHWCPKSAKARICVVMRVILSGVILHFCISGHLPFVSSLCTESCCWESSSWFIQIDCAACFF